MTELEIIIKDLRKEMLPEETNDLDGQKAEFFKNLDAKYPGILGTVFKATKLEPKVEPKTEPETNNVDKIIDEFLDFLDCLIADEDAEENETEDDEEPKLDFERIEFHDPATIVFWNDDTKTVVKARHGDKFDKEKGLAMAITKKVMGNTNKYYDVFEEFCFDEEDEPIQNVLEKFGITPDETDAGNEETFDLEGNSTNEAETVTKPVKEEKPKKGFGLKRGKKQD